MKKCFDCKLEKDESEFNKNKKTKDGLQGWCKTCVKENNAQRYSANPQHSKKIAKLWQEANRERNKENIAKWREINSEHHKETQKKWREANLERQKSNCKRWRQTNVVYDKESQRQWRETHPDYQNNYVKDRRKVDLLFKLRDNLRSRMRGYIKRQINCPKKHISVMDELGCSIVEVIVYLESLFLPGMSWDNYGDWEIDHIFPLSKATSEQHLRQLCHYTNLQPLWAEDNLKKGNKILEPNHE